jgi:gliding motility-associated-like protein
MKIISLFLFITPLILRGQQLITFGGGTLQNGNTSLSYSMGEIAITTLTSTNNIATQGQQQPLSIKSLNLLFFNGLTPNGDGKNDVFLIEGIENSLQNSLVIFNRWGETIFKKDGYQNDWNGVDLKGNNLPEGQYYFVFYPKKGGDKSLKGTILILR